MKFSEYIVEGIQTNHFEQAVKNIVSYIESKLGKLYVYPEIEHFSNTDGSGFGLRYFLENGKSLRFNWTKATNSSSLDSITLWTGKTKTPNFVIRGPGGSSLSDISLAQVLPALVKIIQHPHKGEINITTQESIQHSDEKYLTEDPYDDVINAITSGPVSKFNMSKMGRAQERVFNELITKYRDSFDVKTDAAGRQRFTLIGEPDDFDREQTMNVVAGNTPKKGRQSLYVGLAGDETVETDGELAAEREHGRSVERVPYEEQLEDLRTIVTAVVKGASNFAVVLGAGGLGKSHQVEETLNNLGLSDGNGYFKNTSSGSPAGLYRTLFMNRTGLVLLDDCDTIVNTQEGRNLMKAALDTKKQRKLVWGKAASWLFDPADEIEMENALEALENGEEPERFPKYFNFEGRVIMISNLRADQLDPDGALSTRGFVLTLDPTKTEVFEFMRKIAPNIPVEGDLTPEQRIEVVDLISKQGGDANIRKLVRGLNMAASGVPNWQRIVARYC